jgi:hypothetical protein
MLNCTSRIAAAQRICRQFGMLVRHPDHGASLKLVNQARGSYGRDGRIISDHAHFAEGVRQSAPIGEIFWCCTELTIQSCRTIRRWRSGKEMRDAKANWEFVAYGNALHAFTNWRMPEDGPPPAIYNKQADRRSWIAMQNFFKEIFA